MHKNPLTKDQIPQLVRELSQSTLKPETRIALTLLMLLFVRPRELGKAEWTEFDPERGEWRIPAARMKKRELHVVPLPPQAVALQRELHALTGERKYLFPNVRRHGGWGWIGARPKWRSVPLFEHYFPNGFDAGCGGSSEPPVYLCGSLMRTALHIARAEMRCYITASQWP